MSSNRGQLNQAGMVSITVTLVMMIVISLIVIGFSQVVRRNQREALDRQLSTQAYYAAETGVNDVYAALFTSSAPYTLQPEDATNCNALISHAALSPNLNNDGTVKYTCVLANNVSEDVKVDVPYGKSEVANLRTNGVAPGSLSFTWNVDTTAPASARLATCPTSFTPNGPIDWAGKCPYGVLRVDLFDASSGATDPAAMANASASIFFVPSGSGGSPTTIVQNNASKTTYTVKATCGASNCVGAVSGINSANYYARLSSVYRTPGKVTITPGNPNAKFTGYVIIDSTGQALDELRRIQVRVPIGNQSSYETPLNALNSGSNVCKRFLTGSNVFDDRCSSAEGSLKDIDSSDN